MKPVRPSDDILNAYELEERYPMEYSRAKIVLGDNKEEQEHFYVGVHHLDTNHHVNNGQYIMMAANLLITPYYMGVSIDAVKELIPTLLLPFNATKSVMNAAFVLLLYKPVTRAIRATKLITAPLSASTTVKQNNKMNSVIVAVISLLIIIACFVIFFKFMNGSF
jgi:hypothetical protein